MAKVLCVDQFAHMGGGQRILLDIAEYFSAHGISCVAALPERGPLEGLLADHGIPTKQFSFPGLGAGHKSLHNQISFVFAAKRVGMELAAIASEAGVDLIFCNGPRLAPSAVMAASKLGLPAICAVHLIFGGKERALLSWIFRRPAVKAVTFCSSAAANAFPELDAGKRMLVGNWVSPNFASCPLHENAKEMFDLPGDSLAIGVVGRLSHNKGQGVLLEAAAPILTQRQGVVLVVAGSSDHEDPQEEPRLRTVASELGVADRVRFLGTVSNTVALMDALDILVVPSMWEEPFGLVAVEGMARGLPVIATLSGGLVDIVADGETGILVEKTEFGLRDAIDRLIDDPLLRDEMGRAGRHRALTQFSAPPRLESLAQLAVQLAGRRSAA